MENPETDWQNVRTVSHLGLGPVSLQNRWIFLSIGDSKD